MIKLTLGILISAAVALSAMEHKPILHYDFTKGSVQVEGRYAAPQKHGRISVSTPQGGKGVLFTGNSFMTVPASMGFDMGKAVTFYVLVKFSEPEKPARDMDMIFFKNGDFLLGRDREKLYVNICSPPVKGKYDRSWRAACMAPGVPANRWTVLTSVVERISEKRLRITLYIDGDQLKSQVTGHVFHKPAATPLTIGKGWGGPWFLNGILGRVMIFDKALTHEEVLHLVMKEKYVTLEDVSK